MAFSDGCRDYPSNERPDEFVRREWESVNPIAATRVDRDRLRRYPAIGARVEEGPESTRSARLCRTAAWLGGRFPVGARAMQHNPGVGIMTLVPNGKNQESELGSEVPPATPRSPRP